jgi:two-component system, NtrC family, sensor kinase
MAAEFVEFLSRTKDYLWPADAEKDEAFQLEIQRLSRRGLRLMAIIFACLLAAIIPALLVLPVYPISAEEAAENIILAVAAMVALFVFSRGRWALQHGRWVGLTIILVATLASYRLDLSLGMNVYEAERLVLGDVTGALLVVVVVVPALPWQMLAMGLLMAAAYPVFYSFSNWPVDAPGHDVFPLTFLILMGVVLCAALAAVNYNRLYSLHRSHGAVLGAQRDLLLSESAASIGRLSAALSHELNSPLGSLKSSISTLNDLRMKSAEATPERRARLDELAGQLQRNSEQALDRMERIVHQMQRFTNLDRADQRDCDPDSLIEDVVSLIDPQEREKVQLQLNLGGLPSIYTRPQQMSAALSSLLQNSIESSPNGATVEIASAHVDSRIDIVIADTRPQIPARELNSLFDPSFQVRGRRIGTGNWTWFNARQILRELGGDLRVLSGPGSTTTTITLPVVS